MGKKYPFKQEDFDNILRVADDISNALLPLGVTIHRNDSITTLSVYLKFDYGVLNSVRISDHRGKDQFVFKYNIRTDVEEAYTSNAVAFAQSTEHHFFPLADWEKVVRRILIHRAMLIGKYGEGGYQKFLEDKLAYKAVTKNRFWINARHLG